MNWFMNFLESKKLKTLEQENESLQQKLNDCSEKLAEKQEHINKTNAYWKKKMHQLTTKKSNKK